MLRYNFSNRRILLTNSLIPVNPWSVIKSQLEKSSSISCNERTELRFWLSLFNPESVICLHSLNLSRIFFSGALRLFTCKFSPMSTSNLQNEKHWEIFVFSYGWKWASKLFKSVHDFKTSPILHNDESVISLLQENSRLNPFNDKNWWRLSHILVNPASVIFSP